MAVELRPGGRASPNHHAAADVRVAALRVSASSADVLQADGPREPGASARALAKKTERSRDRGSGWTQWFDWGENAENGAQPVVAVVFGDDESSGSTAFVGIRNGLGISYDSISDGAVRACAEDLEHVHVMLRYSPA